MKRVLFVCVHNAGRSVMAEALAKKFGLDAASAGTEPGEGPHPEVVAAMAEIGIDVSAHRGTPLTDELISTYDIIITMGCAIDADTCPAILYAMTEDWGLPDPKGRPMGEVRAIRDEIARKVTTL